MPAADPHDDTDVDLDDDLAIEREYQELLRLDAESDVDDPLLLDDDPPGPFATLHAFVKEHTGRDRIELPALMAALDTTTVLGALLGWHKGWFSAEHAAGYGTGVVIGAPLFSAVFSGIVEGLVPAISSAYTTLIVAAIGLLFGVHKLGGGIPEAMVLVGTLPLVYEAVSRAIRWHHGRLLRRRGVSTELAAAVLAIRTEPLIPLEAELDHALQGYDDIRGALHGPLRAEPGIDHGPIERDAAALLSAILRRSVAVDRLLGRSVELAEVREGAADHALKRWDAMVLELHQTAEALLTYAADHDESSRATLRHHLDHLRALRAAHAELDAL